MNKIIAITIALLFAVTASAQNHEGFGMEGMQAPQGNPMRQRMTPEQQAEAKTKRMKESLNLSAEQVAKIAEINLEEAAAEQLTREQMRELMAKMREERQAREAAVEAKYKEILNDSQYKKWLKQKQQQKERAQRQFGQGMPQGGGFPPGGMGDRGRFGGGQGGFGGGGFSNEMGF